MNKYFILLEFFCSIVKDLGDSSIYTSIFNPFESMRLIELLSVKWWHEILREQNTDIGEGNIVLLQGG